MQAELVCHPLIPSTVRPSLLSPISQTASPPPWSAAALVPPVRNVIVSQRLQRKELLLCDADWYGNRRVPGCVDHSSPNRQPVDQIWRGQDRDGAVGDGPGDGKAKVFPGNAHPGDGGRRYNSRHADSAIGREAGCIPVIGWQFNLRKRTGKRAIKQIKRGSPKATSTRILLSRTSRRLAGNRDRVARNPSTPRPSWLPHTSDCHSLADTP